jgi:uncharacterized protein YegP (UPF0339 family)
VTATAYTLIAGRKSPKGPLTSPRASQYCPMANDRRFVITRSQNGQYYFFLRADNGEVLVTSETYTTKQSALNGIQAVKDVAASAPIVDMTDR